MNVLIVKVVLSPTINVAMWGGSSKSTTSLITNNTLSLTYALKTKSVWYIFYFSKSVKSKIPQPDVISAFASEKKKQTRLPGINNS